MAQPVSNIDDVTISKDSELAKKKSEKRCKYQNKKYLYSPKIDRIPQLLLTLILRFVVVILFGFVGYYLRHFFDPVRRGFWCSDKSIKYPFHESTVENITLFYICIILATSMIFIGEFFYNNKLTETGQNWKFHIIIWKIIQLARFTTIWMLGIVVSIFLVNVFKISMGSLRPNFMELCKPKYKKNDYENCDNGKDIYILPMEYECTSEYDRIRIMDAKMSFYSGHSSTSFFFATFIILYTHLRIAQKCQYKVQLLSLFIVFYAIIIGLAGFVAASRIFDNKHHPIDVFVGTFAGTLIAILTVFLHKEMFFVKVEEFQIQTAISSMKTVEDRIITENSRV